jgi:hypothetical protein
MRGWFLIIQWRDGSTSWEKLKDLKVLNLVEVAEYAIVNRLINKNLPSNGGCHMLFITEIGLFPRSSHATGRQHTTSLGFVYQRQSKRP